MKPAAIPAVSVLSGQLAPGVCVVPSDAIRCADHEPLASSHEASAASPSKTKAAQPAHGAKSEPGYAARVSLSTRISLLFLRDLVDRVLDVRREVDRARCADPDAGRYVGRKSARRTGQPDRQIAGDFGELSGLRIEFDNPFGADLGHDQFAVGRQRDAFGHFQVLGEDGLFAVAFDLRDLPGKGFRDVDIAVRTTDQSHRTFEAADQHRTVLAMLAADADQRLAAEF